jgi:hypothetical protein
MKLPALLSALLATTALVVAQDAPVDWKTIATEFSADVATAQAKYQGKMITVTGPVSSIAGGDMTLDTPSVSIALSTEDGPGPDVKCLFENSDLEPNTQIFVPDDGSEATLRKLDTAGNVLSTQTLAQTGQQLVITGSFFGYSGGDIVLRHCRIAGGGR